MQITNRLQQYLFYSHSDHLSEAEPPGKFLLLPSANRTPASGHHLGEATGPHTRPSTEPSVQSHPAWHNQTQQVLR